ncbi:uncharacterized protein LOC127369754 [Dicentrarchus labrax]|uniref:uncharacterized protein LOC127369754 n=1 Tax=Dicentrarchus labrax TaxID=13489 RepID=UPI0021F57807|nr:uncharacterized protein LOC127369754 [Dicentrarchus labrax]
MSNNKQWKAIFQDDGNFVIYGWKPVWASDTDGTNVYRLVMQEDCNLIMYNKVEQPRWATNTYVKGVFSSCLQLTDDGKLLVYKAGEKLPQA